MTTATDDDVHAEQEAVERDYREPPATEQQAPIAEFSLEEWSVRIRDVESELDDAEAEVNECKKALKDAKANFDTLVSKMRRYIREGQKQYPLFEQNGHAPAADAWRAVQLFELGIDGQISQSLTEAGLTTLGAIADHTASYQLTDIKGIGPAKAEALQALLDDYWSKHPLTEQPAEEEPDDG